ncbi:MAG: hypothetical protein AABN95_21560 [Acidobacteriota bacterium]
MTRNEVQEMKWTMWGMLAMIPFHASNPSIHASQFHKTRISSPCNGGRLWISS